MAEDEPIGGIETNKTKSKLSLNPIRLIKEYRAKKKLEEEKKLLYREECMKQDLERFLMEIEDYETWVNHQLRIINLQRMKKAEVLNHLIILESKKSDDEMFHTMQENGLSYFKGNIKSYKKWQNSAAKHLDIKGHSGAVYSCKISSCNGFILSCSDDSTAKLWNLTTGNLLKTYSGHLKKVSDCDFHPNFALKNASPTILTASADCTLRLWNTVMHNENNCVTIIKGHTQSIYRCSFSPDGSTFISSSEDKTIRKWCYPEGYLLFIYDAHKSPVTSINFSPTGRLIFLTFIVYHKKKSYFILIVHIKYKTNKVYCFGFRLW
jgi:WD40 repeat protein